MRRDYSTRTRTSSEPFPSPHPPAPTPPHRRPRTDVPSRRTPRTQPCGAPCPHDARPPQRLAHAPPRTKTKPQFPNRARPQRLAHAPPRPKTAHAPTQAERGRTSRTAHALSGDTPTLFHGAAPQRPPKRAHLGESPEAKLGRGHGYLHPLPGSTPPPAGAPARDDPASLRVPLTASSRPITATSRTRLSPP